MNCRKASIFAVQYIILYVDSSLHE